MDRVTTQVDTADRALRTLCEALALEPTVIHRDAAIQRFEYTCEACWKALKAYLAERELLSCPSPAQCFRAALRVGLCTAEDAESLLQMVADRNLTAYTYIEAISVRIAERLPGYALLIGRVLAAIRERITATP